MISGVIESVRKLINPSSSDDTTAIIDSDEIIDDVWIQIFIRLDFKTLQSFFKTSRRFNKIIKTDTFWIERAKYLNVTDVLPPVRWRGIKNKEEFIRLVDTVHDLPIEDCSFPLDRMVASGIGFSKITPYDTDVAELGIGKHHRAPFLRKLKNAIQIGFLPAGDGISIEDYGHNCHRNEEIKKCMAFSYQEAGVHVFIDLIAAGIPAWVLDFVRPKIRISQKVTARNDCASRVAVTAQLNYWPRQFIEYEEDRTRSKTIKKRWDQWTNPEWEDIEIELDQYPSGTRHLTVASIGSDNQFWAGHYGPKIANLEIQVIMPETIELKSYLRDENRTRSDDEQYQMLARIYDSRRAQGHHFRRQMRLRHGDF